jgi:hypothetical protein
MMNGATVVTTIMTAPTMPPGAYGCHDVHGEKFFAIAAIMHVRMSPHYVRQLVCDDRCQL